MSDGASVGPHKVVEHFSNVASGYASFRPRYPDALFAALASLAPDTSVAWDCGAGSGQASVALAGYFERVIATDASASQLAQATPHERVSYQTAPAEASGLDDASVSLVTVAQALHWFNVEAFHREVRRVVRTNGIVAEWTYALLDSPSHPEVAAVVNALDARVRTYWPAERAHVDAHYETLPFPFERVSVPPMAMTAEWTRDQLMGYLATWSAVPRARAATGVDPLIEVASQLDRAWSDGSRATISWPLTVRVGRVG